MIEAKIIADSMSPGGVRLTTLALVYPRFILAELNTHRMISKNSASSRAIPTLKLIEQVQTDMAKPVEWGKNQKGMQATKLLTDADKIVAMQMWYEAGLKAASEAFKMYQLGVHKQIVNRIIEPFMHARTLVTATDWDNFYQLRRHKDAQPEIKALADAMWDAMEESRPTYVKDGEWHVPYFREGEDKVLALAHSVARAARVSYNTHDNKQTTAEADVLLAQRLRDSGHWSPFEHQATPIAPNLRSNNFRGWRQHREIFLNDRNRPIG